MQALHRQSRVATGGRHTEPLCQKAWRPSSLRGSSRCRAAAEVVQQDAAVATTSTVPAITLFYRTGWDKAIAHGSLCGAKWSDFQLSKGASTPAKWLSAEIEVPSACGTDGKPLLEFVVTDASRTHWDKPPAGGNYTIGAPGAYSLRGGALKKLGGNPVLVVSDLDGTMVGDDAATATFRSWWEDCGALRGGMLVYNTGRSLASFCELLRSKSAVMAPPDALISAVGTKVYERDAGGGPPDSERGWRLDAGWAAQLDERWSAKEARDAAYKALAQVGKDAMHFRPPEEQNEHKVTCGVRDDATAGVVATLNASLQSAGVDANVIVSGHGGWKYVDIVPRRAGKLEATNYVRKQHGFSAASTVCCGDSGNDILMLSGENLAIAVGNSQPDLRTWLADQQAKEQPLPSGKKRLLLTGAKEALGILEGLEYFGFK